MANTKNFIAKNGFSTGDGYSMPDVRPSLLLDFANSKTLDPRITFTRGSTATYWDGHTTAKAEENLITYSNLSSDVSTSNASITSTTETAPDGSAQGREITSDGTSTVRVDMSTNVTNGEFYAFSVYLKYVDWQYIALDVQDSRFNGNANIVVDLVNGTITKQNGYSNGTITDVGNGWYRVGFVDLCSFTSSNTFMVYQNDGGTTLDLSGVTSGKKWLIWGMQVEERDAITAYTPTSGSPIVKYQPVLQTAASGEARFDHDPVTGESKGLLIEEARTNTINQSENAPFQFSNVYSQPFLENTAIAPDGNQTADVVYGPRIDTSSRLERGFNYSTGTKLTLSFFQKTMSGSHDSNGSPVWAFQNSIGMTAADVVSEHVGNGWYRMHYVMTTTASSQTLRLYYSSAVAQDDVIAVWGYQLEVGAFPTSYIPTSGSTVTRSLDSCKIDDLSKIDYNQGNGTTMLIEAQTAGNSSLRGLMNLSDSSESNFYGITETNGTIIGRLRSNGTYEVLNTTVTGLSAGEYATTAMSIDFNSLSARTATNGTVSTEDTSFSQTVPETIIRFAIGTISSSSYIINGCVKKAALYPKAFNSATLQAMTEE